MSKAILGISAQFHDSAACILVDGAIVAAAQEERFTRKKHDASLPLNAIAYCLAEAGLEDNRLEAVAFYDKPIDKFYRIMESFLAVSPKGYKSFSKVIPSWLQDKLWLPPQINSMLEELGVEDTGQLYFTQHHESHAASAFYPSPYEEAAILTMDGVGEWATASIGVGEGSSIRLLEEMHFPHSLGLLYSAFTFYCGFRVNADEYKLMGLAPYGSNQYGETIKRELLDIKEDGSFRLNMKYFGFLDDLVMVNDDFSALFGGPARPQGAPITREVMNIARSIQAVTEELVLLMAQHARHLTGKKNLCLAGGVALNCVANGRLVREKLFDDLWIQPAADDAGGSLGAALSIYHNEMDGKRKPRKNNRDDMSNSLLGPDFSDQQVEAYLDAQGAVYNRLEDGNRSETIAQLIANEKVVGLFDGRMEFGPRSLGNRSIIADPRSANMQSVLNQKIKFRESFRPFAAAVLEEKVADYFDIAVRSPYMLIVATIRDALRKPAEAIEDDHDLRARLAQQRSTLPAITHVDYSCRLQTVNEQEHPRFHGIIKAFEAITGVGAIINTSFNVRDEPIVCTPTDAWRCFMHTQIDVLVIGPFLIMKEDQASSLSEPGWEKLYSEE